MTSDDYNNVSELQHLRRDASDAHSSAQLAKWLLILVLIGAAIALWVAVSTMNKAGEAQISANRNSEQVQRIN